MRKFVVVQASGQQKVVEANKMWVDSGHLLFQNDKGVSALFAPGRWSNAVESTDE